MLSRGDVVCNFSLSDQHGNTVTLDELIATGPSGLFCYLRTSTVG